MHHSAQADHARHDVLLIARHASGDLSNLDTEAADAQLAACPDCGAVYRDLIALSAATRALPRTARAPRDFRITAEQAGRLHRGSWLRAVLGPFASARSATRPIAAALTSAGVAGLLVAAFVPALFGAVASAPGGAAGALAPGATQAAVGAPAYPQAAPGAAAASEHNVLKQGDGSGMEVAVDGAVATDDRDGTLSAAGEGSGAGLSRAAPPNLLVLASAGLLALGLAMFGLRIAARRLR